MKTLTRAVCVLVVGFTCFAGLVQSASAQAIIRAVYRVSLTDPATGNVYYSDRQSLRSWSTEDQCEVQKNSFSGFHTDSVSRMNIVNSDGTPLEVAMASVHCVVIRE